jgi:hypothetical protein
VEFDVPAATILSIFGLRAEVYLITNDLRPQSDSLFQSYEYNDFSRGFRKPKLGCASTDGSVATTPYLFMGIPV